MKEIKLSQGKTALVDDADFDWLNQWKWFAAKSKKTFYARRAKDKNQLVHMHREILGISSETDLMPDHIDRNGLNNQRFNLRIATITQNNSNQTIRVNKSSKYRGVSIRDDGRWKAEIRSNKKLFHLGYFNDERDAAIAYNKKAIELRGDFANLNLV